MKIIGIESSGLVASVAVVEDGILLAEYTTDHQKTHSQTLLPMLEEIGNMIELDLKTVDAIAVSSGPGSFTGLRIGSATAKGLGLALKIPIVEVPTLQGIAYHFWGSDRLICPMLDARRGQVYSGLYAFLEEGRDFRMETVLEQCAEKVEGILEKINEHKKPVIFAGDGVLVYRDIIEHQIQVPYSFAPAGKNRQRAANIAALGSVLYAGGKMVEASMHRPEYLRKGQAGAEQKDYTKI